MTAPTMALPAGKTCADCAHAARCTMLGCTSLAATTCDFAPSRFVEAYRAPERPKGGGYVSPLDPPPGDPRAAHHCKKGEPCRCTPTRLRAVKETNRG
jgi:hypothetical protein